MLVPLPAPCRGPVGPGSRPDVGPRKRVGHLVVSEPPRSPRAALNPEVEASSLHRSVAVRPVQLRDPGLFLATDLVPAQDTQNLPSPTHIAAGRS